MTLVLKTNPLLGQALFQEKLAWFLELEEEIQPIQVRYCLNPSAGNRVFWRKGFYVLDADSQLSPG